MCLEDVELENLSHTHSGRNMRSVLTLMLVLIGLVALLATGLHWGIVLVLSLFVVPTLVDVVFNPVATFTLNDEGIQWKNATQEAEIQWHQVKSAHFATRLNVAFRTTLIMYDDAKVRIPQDVLPPRSEMEAALKHHDIPILKERLRLI